MGQDLAGMRADAEAIFKAGLAAVAPETAVQRYLRREGDRLTVGECVYDLNAFTSIRIVAAGKAAAAMAAAAEGVLGGRVAGGVAVTKYGHGGPLRGLELIEAGHPVPDENSAAGARAVLRHLAGVDTSTLVLCLISGGGSALLALPAEGLSLADKQATTRVLLACGASIHEINTLRKHLSAVKGGQLARAAQPAAVATLILSDVVGDDLDIIASGPTVPDRGSFADCQAIVRRHAIADDLPSAVLERIAAGAAGRAPETPKPGDPLFAGVHNQIVGSNFDAVAAAAHHAEILGYRPLILSSLIEGETRHVAAVHAAIAREVVRSGHPLPAPACILSGGETTVTLTGDGKGGRNQEFALAAALDIDDRGPIVVLSGGTDGTDGPTDAAGAIADAHTAARARAAGLDPQGHLAANDAYPFFEALGDLLMTGPTRTNVMDLRIVLVGTAL